MATKRGTKSRKARRAAQRAPAARDHIVVSGARVHNLRNISLAIPKRQLVCFTGVSGSGKSSLAFDTLYAEGQRRYIESLSSYARQFMGELPKPDVDQISGLAPSISIQQKTSGWNPRSTVGTITQIHDYLRVLYARAGTSYCPQCQRRITAQSRQHILQQLLELPAGTRFLLLAPRVRGQKGEYKDLFAELLAQGFARARVDGRIIELSDPPELDRWRRHDIEVVVDRLVIADNVRPRLAEALDLALEVGQGTAIAMLLDDAGGRDLLLSAGFACTACGLSFDPPAPQMFSFNSPQGMCDYCDGLGTRYDFDPELLIPDPRKSLLDPCIAAWRTPPGRWRRHIYQGVAEYLGVDLDQPWQDLPAEARQALLYGTGETHITFEWHGRHGVWKHGGTFEGIINELHAAYRKSTSAMVRRLYERFMRTQPCPQCGGARLKPQALAVRLRGKLPGAGGRLKKCELNIDELCRLSIARALEFMEHLEFDAVGWKIAEEPLKETIARLRFLVDVGLDYLTLDRAAPTLSGGESQRIRLASQIGCGLVGVLYVLDEPSIGLHPRDNRRLLDSLKKLRDMGNTVIVVEHDRDTMLAADRIVDFGPGPGVRGGEVVAEGSVDEIVRCERSLTGAYLAGREEIPTPATRRPVRPPKRRNRRATQSM